MIRNGNRKCKFYSSILNFCRLQKSKSWIKICLLKSGFVNPSDAINSITISNGSDFLGVLPSKCTIFSSLVGKSRCMFVNLQKTTVRYTYICREIKQTVATTLGHVSFVHAAMLRPIWYAAEYNLRLCSFTTDQVGAPYLPQTGGISFSPHLLRESFVKKVLI